MTARERLAVIVPSKNRPENAERLLHACNETAGDQLDKLVFAIDPDEAMALDYYSVIPEAEHQNLWDWVDIVKVTAEPQRIGPILNVLGPQYTEKYEYIGFMGDDHMPRTMDWDEKLIDSLEGRPGVAYGNDLVQGERLPTEFIVSSDIVRSLGYLVPPGLDHMYFDDFWKLLGQEIGNLRYSPGVIIEHLHPSAGAAEWDASYLVSNNPGQLGKDGQAYQRFLAEQWPADLAKLKGDLNL